MPQQLACFEAPNIVVGISQRTRGWWGVCTLLPALRKYAPSRIHASVGVPVEATAMCLSHSTQSALGAPLPDVVAPLPSPMLFSTSSCAQPCGMLLLGFCRRLLRCAPDSNVFPGTRLVVFARLLIDYTMVSAAVSSVTVASTTRPSSFKTVVSKRPHQFPTHFLETLRDSRGLGVTTLAST